MRHENVSALAAPAPLLASGSPSESAPEDLSLTQLLRHPPCRGSKRHLQKVGWGAPSGEGRAELFPREMASRAVDLSTQASPPTEVAPATVSLGPIRLCSSGPGQGRAQVSPQILWTYFLEEALGLFPVSGHLLQPSPGDFSSLSSPFWSPPCPRPPPGGPRTWGPRRHRARQGMGAGSLPVTQALGSLVRDGSELAHEGHWRQVSGLAFMDSGEWRIWVPTRKRPPWPSDRPTECPSWQCGPLWQPWEPHCFLVQTCHGQELCSPTPPQPRLPHPPLGPL